MHKFYLLFCCCLLSLCAPAQQVMLGTGFTIGTQSTGIAQGFGAFTFIPDLRFHLSEHGSFSVGVPVMFGATDVDNILQSSLVFDINRGAGSSKGNSDRFGYFLGAGVGFQAIFDAFFGSDDVFSDHDAQAMHGAGPMINAGFRMNMGKRGTNLELRFSGMKTLDRTRTGVFQVSLICNFSPHRRTSRRIKFK